MSMVVYLGVFAISWFLTFIMVLPIGLANDTNEHGAPANPRLLMKAGVATIAAIVLIGIFYALARAGVIAL